MEDDCLGLELLTDLPIEDVGSPDLLVLLHVRESLLLNPRHIDNVQVPQFQFLPLLEPYPGSDLLEDLRGHSKQRRSDQAEFYILEVGQGSGQGVDRPAVLEIADHSNMEPVDPAAGIGHGEQVQQGLGGVLVGSVAGVDHRDLGQIGCKPGAPFQRVADDHDVGVALDHLDRVVERFTLLDADRPRSGEPDHLPAEPFHSRSEGELRSGRGLEEEGGHDPAPE